MPETASSQKADFQYQRLPAKDRLIKDISPDKDVRVRVTGKIIDKTESGITVDDSSGNKEIFVPKQTTKQFKLGDNIRAFCRVIATEDGYQLEAEIIQNMNELDLEKYRKIIFLDEQ